MKKKVNKHNKSIFEIPLSEAKELTTAWAEQKHLIKAFLVDADELSDMISEKKAKYVRMYFGWDKEMEVGREVRMIMVPVDINGKDMILLDGESSTETNAANNIFDFTMPCPPTCSPDPIL
ncbi:hypothetical protein [Pedobacter gandavensis]|uniref:Uncharacterized protein n=1 Tax=Pedobacter gandavensis TaxID=2679963 RepID=A0ABR6F2W0_9SPHI|nr:hypothetical protein [Pedobacter gandavensis]MBB2151557.1 hypothetical protein [Pedobacter gandavensis]